jgi:peptide/nickel transport system substrate-binding protein
MASQSYNRGYRYSKFGRRKFLSRAVAGTAGVSALALVGCGGDDDDDDDAPSGGDGTTTAPTTGTDSTATTSAPTGAIPNGEGGFPATFEEARSRYHWSNFKNIPGQDQGPVYGGTMVYAGSDPGNWDVTAPGATIMATLVGRHYNGLVTFPQSDFENAHRSVAEGDLAESWEQPDDLSFVFTLHDGILWQDKAPVNGRPLTAEDVVLGYEALQAAPTQGANYNEVTSFEAPDEKTVVFNVSAPAAYMIRNMMNVLHVVAPKELLDDRDLFARDAVGTGPFILESWEAGGTVTMNKNPTYFRKWNGHQLPFLDRIELPNFVGNDAGADAAFRAGDHVVRGGLDQRIFKTFLEERPDLILQIQTPAPSVPYGVDFKLEDERWQDERVRRALALGIDRQAIIQGRFDGYAGGGYAQDWSFFKDSAGNYREWPWEENEMGAWHHTDYEEATKLLAAAGYDADNKLEFTLTILSTSGFPVQDVNLLTIDQWQSNLPITVTTDPREWLAYFASQYARDYVDTIGAWTHGPAFDPDGYTYQALHSNAWGPDNPAGPNQFGVVDTDLDPMLEQQRRLLDEEERAALCDEIRLYDLDKCYRIWQCNQYKFTARQPNVFNIMDTIHAWTAGGWGTKGDEKAWILPQA